MKTVRDLIVSLQKLDPDLPILLRGGVDEGVDHFDSVDFSPKFYIDPGERGCVGQYDECNAGPGAFEAVLIDG